MKKSELRQIIKEEISNVLNEKSKSKKFDFNMGIFDDIEDEIENGDWENNREIISYLNKILKFTQTQRNPYPQDDSIFSDMEGDIENMDEEDIDGYLEEIAAWITNKIETIKSISKMKTYRSIEKFIEAGSKNNLDLSNTKTTSLPNNFTVEGDLNLKNTPITQLPKNLKVGGELNLKNTKITSLPQGLIVGGTLNLYDTPITSLPRGLTVGGNLHLNNTPITSLPQGLTVGGYLDISKTSITSLPQDLQLNGALYIIRTPLSKKYTTKQIRQMAPGVKEKIFRSNLSSYF